MLILHANFSILKATDQATHQAICLRKNENGVFNKLDQTSGPADAAPCPQQALEVDASE